MRYRPHIDGLRAVAIIPVVLLHAGMALVPGGFTGVDMFFVISGFLIASLIVEEIGEGRFGLLDFYRRRALRILPAYLAVVAAVLAASWFTFFPDETRALGRSVAAASLFVSNIYFWRSSDYFDSAFEPLLHTWTLSVEEQFYILLPVFLVLVAKVLGRRYAAALLAATLASFALNLWSVTRYPEATFFLLPTRIWEFGLGALAAVTGLAATKSASGARMRGLGAAAGAALVAWAIFRLDQDSVFPGANALFPAVGAMLLIACAEGNLAGRILASPPLVALGRISYSLYLWHWPIIVFWKMQVNPVLGLRDGVAVVTLSLAAAALSFRFIEQPFRRPELRRMLAIRIGVPALAALALVAVFGGALVAGANGWGRYPPGLARIAGYAGQDAERTPHPCFVHARTKGRERAFDLATCLAPGPGAPTLLILGDSHAEHLVPAIEAAYPELNLQFAGATGCTPTIDVVGDWYCPRVMGPVIRDHIPKGGVDVLLLSARWEPEDIAPLRASVDYYLDYVDEVVILGPTPEYLDSFPLVLARSLRRGSDPDRLLDPKVRALDRQMAARDWGGARYVSLHELICPNACRHLTDKGVPYLWDYGHYTRAGAREIVDDLAVMYVVASD